MSDLSIEKLTRVYIKMSLKKAALAREIDELEASMKTVKLGLKECLKEAGVDSAKTEAGTVHRVTRTKYATADWDGMYAYIVEHNIPQLLQKTLHQSNTKQYLEENPDAVLPGVLATTEYEITVKKPQAKRSAKNGGD